MKPCELTVAHDAAARQVKRKSSKKINLPVIHCHQLIQESQKEKYAFEKISLLAFVLNLPID